MTHSQTEPSKQARPRWRRWVRRVVVFVAVLYLAILLVFYQIQNTIIFPGAATQGRPTVVVTPANGQQLIRLTTAGGQRIVALFAPAINPNGSARFDPARCPTVLFFYGNGMCMADARGELETLRALGANVMIPEYVGYGMSSGDASEQGIYATADAAYEHLSQRPDIDPKNIVVAGWSLGAAAALDLAHRKAVSGVALFSAFTSMRDMARRIFPLFPTGLLLRSHFANEQKIQAVTCPIFIAHGTRDELIPLEMANRLAAAARTPVTRFDVEDAGHGDIFITGGAALERKLGGFLQTLNHRP